MPIHWVMVKIPVGLVVFWILIVVPVTATPLESVADQLDTIAQELESAGSQVDDLGAQITALSALAKNQQDLLDRQEKAIHDYERAVSDLQGHDERTLIALDEAQKAFDRERELNRWLTPTAVVLAGATLIEGYVLATRY